jgi:Mor family transcriptional regulator
MDSKEIYEVMLEALEEGIPIDEIIRPKRKYVKKAEKEERERRYRPLKEENAQRRLKPGTIYGAFEILKDTGKTGSNGGIYLTRCTLCGKGVAERGIRNMKRVKSCGCLSSQLKKDAMESIEDLKFCAKHIHEYCDPSCTTFKRTRKPGFMTLHDFSGRERTMLAELCESGGCNGAIAAESILGERFPELLDMFQGDTIEFPLRETIRKLKRTVHLWQDFKDGMSFDELGRKYEANTKSVVKTLYSVSARLQLTAFYEVAYAHTGGLETHFTDELWGTWGTCQRLHEVLYEAMKSQGDMSLATHYDAIVEEKLKDLELKAKILGVYAPETVDTQQL